MNGSNSWGNATGLRGVGVVGTKARKIAWYPDVMRGAYGAKGTPDGRITFKKNGEIKAVTLFGEKTATHHRECR